MNKKNVLGRGLGVYFPEYNSENTSNKNSDIQKSIPSLNKDSKSSSKSEEGVEIEPLVNVVLQVPVQHIRANPNQPRKEFDAERLDELAASIKTHGIIQPITVRYIGEKRFELISGERRLRASKLAGMNEIPAYIREADDEQSMAFALIENIQREDLNSLEVALAYKRLLEEFSYTQAEVAEKVGKNRTTVTNMLRLLNLPDFIQLSLKMNQISMGHARALLNIEDASEQKKILNATIKNDWSVRQVENAVREIGTPATKKIASKEPQNPFYNDVSARLRKTFSTKVQVKPKGEGGEIKIEYYSEEDFERILSLLDAIK